MTNVSLVCQDGVITSHKIIVAGISEFIRGLMEEAVPSNDPVTIIMPDFETIIVERMIGDVLTKDAASNSGIGQAFKIQSNEDSGSVTMKTENDSFEETFISLEEEADNETTLSEILECDVDDVEDRKETVEEVEDIPVFKQVGNGEFLGKEIEIKGTHSNIRPKTDGRRADYDFKLLMTFNTSEEYYSSDFYKDLKDVFTPKNTRKNIEETVFSFTCKTSNSKRYLPCPRKIKVVIDNESTKVTVEEASAHEHIPNPEYDTSRVPTFQWSRKSTDIIEECLKLGKMPKYIQRKLEEGGCFNRNEEPTKLQLYHKIYHMKKSSQNYVPKSIKRRRARNAIPRILPKSELDMLKRAAELEEQNNVSYTTSSGIWSTTK